MSKKTSKKRQQQLQRNAAKRHREEQNQAYKKKVLQIQKEHNKVKYRNLPGLKGKYPYQLTPWTFAQAEEFMKTGMVTYLKGGDLQMVKVILAVGTDLSVVTDVVDNDSGLHVDFTAVEAAPLSTTEAPAEAVNETVPDATQEETPATDAAPVDTATTDVPAADTATQDSPSDSTPAPEVTGQAEVEMSDGTKVEVEVKEQPAS